MCTSIERTWASLNTEGMIVENPGPTFYLWNFEVEGDQPKNEHIEFIRGASFQSFLMNQFDSGRKILIRGLASSSGTDRYNFEVSRRRALNVLNLTLSVLRNLRRRCLIDPTLSDAQLIQAFRVQAERSNVRLIWSRQGDPHTPVNLEHGEEYARERCVQISAQTMGVLSDDQIETIGRAYMRRRFPNLPQNFLFWEMWTPTGSAMDEIVPRTLSQSGAHRGSRLPPDRYYPHNNGVRNMRSAGFVPGEYVTMRWLMRNFQYNQRDVHRNIDHFIGHANSARNRTEIQEQNIVRALNRSVSMSYIAYTEDVPRYLKFRNPTFLSDTTCMLLYNGFRPVDFRNYVTSDDIVWFPLPGRL